MGILDLFKKSKEVDINKRNEIKEKTRILFNNKEYDAALKSSENLIKYDPDYSFGYFYKAACLVAFNKRDEAVIYCDKALKCDSSSNAKDLKEVIQRGDRFIGIRL